MECITTSTARNRKVASAGSTLVELAVAAGLSGLVFSAVAAFSVFTTRAFIAMSDHVSLGLKSRNALDQISRDIRQTDFLTNYVTDNSLIFQTTNPTNSVVSTLSYIYNPGTGILSRLLMTGANTQSNTLVTDCSYYHFDLFQRNTALTNGGGDLVSTTVANQVKAVEFTWTCTRAILGRTNTYQDVQSARVVIRKD
jgi:Tfp pilus assembly protein PilW